jgi:membrane associated rhomboid family serine protease
VLILPVGQADSTVRRHPLVSYVVIGLCLAVFLLCQAGQPGRQWQVEVQEKFGETIRYLLDTPHLELPPSLAQECGGDCRELEALRALRRRETGAPPAWVLEAQQQQLDRAATELVALLRRDPIRRLGFVPARPDPVLLLTSMFVHAGLLHILGNLLFFFIAAPFVEDVYGRPLFTGLYLLSGVAAAMTHAGKFPDSTTPLVGASGAIAGVMGAFLIRLGARSIRLLILPVPILPLIRFTVSLPAFVVLPLWLGEQFFYARVSETAAGVAWWAHIGGFAFGAGAALAIRLARFEERVIHPAIEKKISFEMSPHIQAAIDHRFQGHLDSARAVIRKALVEEPANADAWRESYEIAVGAGDLAEAGRSALRALELYVRQGEDENVTSLAEDAVDRAAAGLPPRFYLAAGSHLEKTVQNHLALRQYQELVDRHPDDPAAFRALFRRGEILRRAGELRDAEAAFTRARAHPACTGALADAVERALAELRRPARPGR